MFEHNTMDVIHWDSNLFSMRFLSKLEGFRFFGLEILDLGRRQILTTSWLRGGPNFSGQYSTVLLDSRRNSLIFSNVRLLMTKYSFYFLDLLFGWTLEVQFFLITWLFCQNLTYFGQMTFACVLTVFCATEICFALISVSSAHWSYFLHIWAIFACLSFFACQSYFRFAWINFELSQ